MESLADRWAEISEKVAEQEKNLSNALMQSGKFQDAMASLMAWLAETEEMVAAQKSPSPEQRVVKAQLQEQKVITLRLDPVKVYFHPCLGLFVYV